MSSHLIKLLDSHVSQGKKEEKDVSFTKSSLLINPDILNKSCKVGHITGSALVIDPKNGSFLLHYHKKLNKWFQFGGHPENETDPAEIALREASEETGLKDLYFYPRNEKIVPADIDVHVIPENKDNPTHYHYDFRYILATESPDSINFAIEDESNNFKWLTFDSSPDLDLKLDDSLLRLINKAAKIYKKKF